MLSNPIVQGTGLGVFVTQGTGSPNLLNALIEGQLYQFPNPIPSTVDPEKFSEGNIIEGNILIVPSKEKNAIGVSNSRGAVVRDNLIQKGRFPIAFGALNLSGLFPGTCSGDSTRFCLANSDCNIDIDGNGTVDVEENKGTCNGAQTVNVDSISEGGIVENNEITGPFLGGIQLATPNIIARGNHIIGPVWPNTDFANAATGGGAGFELRGRALTTVSVIQNSVSNVPAALRIINAQSFAGKISFNDFTDYDKAVLTPSGYGLPTELSVDPEGNVCGPNSLFCRGNYWGLSCNEEDGFDPDRVVSLLSGIVQADGTVNITGPVNVNVHDSHPFGIPVAGLSEELIPTTLAEGYCSGQ
jgi:hypothetical protein